jgi:DNA-binding HxlR family transcriptional regulator
VRAPRPGESGDRLRRSFPLGRFDDLQQSLGLARNVLSDRPQRLVDEGLLTRRLYQERPPRHKYAPTQKAHDLFPVLGALIRWGDNYYAPNGPPRLFRHRGCGGAVVQKLSCEACEAEVTAVDLESRPGPGARSTPAQNPSKHGELIRLLR